MPLGTRQAGPFAPFLRVPPSAHHAPPVWGIALASNLPHLLARAERRRPPELKEQ
jgi:hypothetical protein